MFFLTNMAYASLPVFLPKILTEMGHSALSAQALAAPPYVLAFGLVLVTARLSDRARARSPLIIANAVASAVGYGVLALSRRPFGLDAGSVVRYIAVYPAAAGFFNVVVLLIAWTINNQPSEGRQGGAFALFQVVGQCGPLVGTRLYPEREAPFYERGMAVMAAAMLGVAVLAVVLRLWLGRVNAKMDGKEGGKGRGGEGEADEEEMLVGSLRRRTPGVQRFRYML
jgi:MFS transporter, ACS family, DAL5 transporter family protein